MTRRWPLLAALLAAASLAALVFSLVQVRSDLGELLPQGGGAAARVMTAALQSGPASGLVLIGLEGAPDARLAAISTAMGNTLRRDPSFRLVSNGQQLLDPAAQADLFAHRYLLSPATTAAAFETPALRQDFQALLDGLSSSASPVIQHYGLPDPTGAFRTLAAQWIGGSDVRLQNGVWFARNRGRALMLAQLRTAGLDLGAEDRALAAIGAAFHAAQDSTQGGASARLLVSGPAVFAHDAAHAVQADVRLLSVASSLLVAGLLFWRFRSLWSSPCRF